MQFLIWALIITITFGSGLSISSFAQNTGVAPIYIDRAIYNAAQEGFLCSQETIDKLDPSDKEARMKICGLNFKIDNEIQKTVIEDHDLQASTVVTEPQDSTSEPTSSVVNSEGEEISLLPDPEVNFVEDYVVKFDGDKDTIFLGGVVPFVAIPDTELATDDSFFNDDSFSVFFYLKRKF